MRQRVMIAMALAGRPEILIADEPTTALDVTVQAQILDLLRGLQQEYGMAIIFITHDLGVVAELCDDVIVMYAGRIAEQASVRDLFKSPRHPYTHGLIRSLPTPDMAAKSILPVIDGVVPKLTEMPSGCRFSNRCAFADELCRRESPGPDRAAEDHTVACHHWRNLIA
jgi:peptide/nickel transport system ATP-binding protein